MFCYMKLNKWIRSMECKYSLRRLMKRRKQVHSQMQFDDSIESDSYYTNLLQLIEINNSIDELKIKYYLLTTI